MATVHPSRMGLVPQDLPKSRDASPSSSSRRRGYEQDRYERREYSKEQRHERSRSRDRSDRIDKDVRDRDRDRYGRRERSAERDYDRRRSRREDSPERRQEDRKDGDRDENRNGDRRRQDARGDDGYRRRASPAYDDYRRSSPPPPRDGEGGKDGSGGDRGQPWRRPENVYPSRGGGRGGYGGVQAGSDFMESRRLQRESTTKSIWPPSPKAPSRELLPLGDHKRSKRSRRSASVSSDSDDDSEEERRRRRERKEKKRARKEKEKKDRKDKKKRKRYSDEEEEEEEDRREDDRRRRDRSKRRSRSRTVDDRSLGRSRSPTRPPVTDDEEANDDEAEWVEKPSATATTMPPPAPNSSKAGTSTVEDEEDYSDDEVGPQPITRVDTRNNKRNESRYGGALLRGEGSAMAAFLQDDTQTRIPRRGEIGLTSDEIANYESVGYVMSGSRHRRMNAVRMRKENQVISAEEKRGILKLQKEERERREAILREEFAELIKDNLKKTGKP